MAQEETPQTTFAHSRFLQAAARVTCAGRLAGASDRQLRLHDFIQIGVGGSGRHVVGASTRERQRAHPRSRPTNPLRSEVHPGRPRPLLYGVEKVTSGTPPPSPCRRHTSREVFMRIGLSILCVVAAGLTYSCASQGGAQQSKTTDSCDMAAASPWISRWLGAWELTAREILKVPDVPAPNITFFDSSCVYTTSSVSANGAKATGGPSLMGQKLPWRAVSHTGTITAPNAAQLPVGLMSFANSDKETGPYFVMAAPSVWAQSGFKADPIPVFIHEFAHTRQMKSFFSILGPIDATWPYAEELDDDAVQTHFKSTSVCVAAYIAERDLLYRAANAESPAEVRKLAQEGLDMIRARHARWFVGDNAVFATLDSMWLSMEGSAQWAAHAWLAHPQGGGLSKQGAVEKMIGSKRSHWSQDESLAIFLVVDRLLPGWPLLVFGDQPMGAVELLERAIKNGS